MATEETRWSWWIKVLFKIRLLSAVLLVYITYNPEGLSYYHWAIRPWFDGFFGKSKLSAAGPHSVKAFIGVIILIGWFLFLRTTKRKIGMIGIMLTLGFFGTFGWMLSDWGFLPTLGGRILEHVVLLITSFILMLGVLLPDFSKKEPKVKKNTKKKKEPSHDNKNLIEDKDSKEDKEAKLLQEDLSAKAKATAS